MPTRSIGMITRSTCMIIRSKGHVHKVHICDHKVHMLVHLYKVYMYDQKIQRVCPQGPHPVACLQGHKFIRVITLGVSTKCVHKVCSQCLHGQMLAIVLCLLCSALPCPALPCPALPDKPVEDLGGTLGMVYMLLLKWCVPIRQDRPSGSTKCRISNVQ